RLLGNLGRFQNVTYRPERVKFRNLLILGRLTRQYMKQGWAATKFFFTTLWKTLTTSPRSMQQMVILLGMYQHFCKVHGETMNWNPWATPQPHSSGEPLKPTSNGLALTNGAVKANSEAKTEPARQLATG